MNVGRFPEANMMSQSHPIHRVLCVAAAIAIAVLVGSPAVGYADADWDDDGVPDAVDACPASEPSDLVGSDGCTVCACDGGWTSHTEYLACIARWVKDARADGAMTARDGRMMLRRARNSTCGTEMIRCCVFQPFDAAVGRCRITTEAACDALDDRLFDSNGEADDEETGSCLPNPCSF
jgi:hypothetical protein